MIFYSYVASSFLHCFHPTIGFIQYAAMVCYSGSAAADIQEACRIVKRAMSALKQFDSYMDQMPRVFFIYYAFVAPLTEQLQSCAENLRRGFECGIASGDTSFGEINYLVKMSCLKYFINQVCVPTSP